jgi:uracil-DNA glycosylase
MNSSTALSPCTGRASAMPSTEQVAEAAAEAVAALLDEVRHTLLTLSKRGCPGFDVADESLATVERWGTLPPARALREAGIAVATPAPDSLAGLGAIRAELGDCRRCTLAQGRSQIVFGSGNSKAALVFVGEGPGREEDLSGEPFVGPAGELLTKIITAMKLTREDVYICNVVKCRPPGNRLPQPAEMAACMHFLKAQLRAIDPKVICTLGACATQALLETDTPISKLRGRFHAYAESRLMPTFHPAYLLRHPEAKRAVWSDMQQIMKVLGVRGIVDSLIRQFGGAFAPLPSPAAQRRPIWLQFPANP